MSSVVSAPPSFSCMEQQSSYLSGLLIYGKTTRSSERIEGDSGRVQVKLEIFLGLREVHTDFAFYM